MNDKPMEDKLAEFFKQLKKQQKQDWFKQELSKLQK